MKNNFRSLKRKMILWVILTAVISVLVAFLILELFIDGIFQDPFARAFVFFCKSILRMTNDEAILFYQRIFRDNKEFWVLLGYFALLLVIFYNVLNRFTKYFSQVNTALDKLIDESAGYITLPGEIEFMEKKLNSIKETLKKKTYEAKEAEQRKNDLVMYLAHDIKTPLTSVIGYLSLLDEAKDMPEMQKSKYITITLEKSYRLEQLINEFFDITRFSLQSIALEKQNINLSYMLLQMADEFYPVLAQSGKKAVVEAGENLSLFGDPDKLARVFNNLMKNAIAYSYENSTIEITAKPVDNNMVISFINHGNVIPEQKLNTIFDKFYRLDEARSTNTGGSGLGLAIAKKIVTEHGGTIAAQSDETRTEFTIILPIRP